MEKGKSVETVNGEVALPEALIQHIQSYLSGKQAARTTLLSNTWYNAWLTRPTLDFNESYFPNNMGQSLSPVFERFVAQTMQRYQDLSLKVDSFRLRIFSYQRKDVALKNWIVSALKMGATDVDLELPYYFTLPQEVFSSKTLLKVSVKGCRVEGNYVINCSRLKSLRLEHIKDESKDVLNDIILCCNLIEELTLSHRFDLTLSPVNLYELPKLRRLYLESVDADSTFFSDFASRFPCLKDLSVHHCHGCTRIQIASTSLETVSYKPYGKSYRAKFDVPNIRKFSCSTSGLPQLSINAASRAWEFDIDIFCKSFHKASWFLNLKKLLKKFTLSRISLSITLGCREYEESSEHEVDIKVVPDPLEVENLSIVVPSSFCSALLVCLFGILRPKFITDKIYLWTNADSSLNVLYKRMMHEMITLNCGIPDHVMFGQFGLKKVNMEVYQVIDAMWQPLELKEPLDLCKTPVEYGKVRFELIWE